MYGQLVTEAFKSLARARSMSLITAVGHAFILFTSCARLPTFHAKFFAAVLLRGHDRPISSRQPTSTCPHRPVRERVLPCWTPENPVSPIRISIGTLSSVANPSAVSIAQPPNSHNSVRLMRPFLTPAGPCPLWGIPKLIRITSVGAILTMALATAATCCRERRA